MKKLIVIMTVILGIIFSGCKKEDPNSISPDNLTDSVLTEKHSLLIIKNGTNHIEYLYTDSTIISYTNYSSGEHNEYIFTNDSTVINTYNINDILKNKETYYFNTENQIEYVNCYKDENATFVQKKIYEYQQQVLTKVDGYIPELFKFQNGNIQEYETVSDDAIWTKYKYEYNNKQNAFFMINLPETEIQYISNNAIVSVIAEWTENVDGMGQTIPSIEHIDTIYTSTFEYNTEGLISKEFRKLSNSIDTLEYLYSTETEWIKN